jgi:hypothetical protein
MALGVARREQLDASGRRRSQTARTVTYPSLPVIVGYPCHSACGPNHRARGDKAIEGGGRGQDPPRRAKSALATGSDSCATSRAKRGSAAEGHHLAPASGWFVMLTAFGAAAVSFMVLM